MTETNENGEEREKTFRERNAASSDMLTQLQQNRRIIEDFTVTTLAAIPSLFGRLIYVSSLRDLASGRYEHAGLLALHPEEAVQQALGRCHEEIFERLLETSLAEQEEDVRTCLQAMSGSLALTSAHWQRVEAYRVLMPEQSPSYLKELFCSNLRAILEILQSQSASPRADA